MSQPQYQSYPQSVQSGPVPQYQPYGYAPMAMQPAGNPPPDHIGWAVVAILFFWPLAIAAFIQRSKIQPAWMMGDIATAQKASADTKKYGVIALILGLVWIAVVIIAVVTTAATITSTYGY